VFHPLPFLEKKMTRPQSNHWFRCDLKTNIASKKVVKKQVSKASKVMKSTGNMYMTNFPLPRPVQPIPDRTKCHTHLDWWLEGLSEGG